VNRHLAHSACHSTWAKAEHLRKTGSHVKQGPLDLVSTGFQKVSAGLTFKQSISRHWAWYSTFAISQAIAELKKVQAREISSGQIGILYFQR
jgi:hypothetical protein